MAAAFCFLRLRDAIAALVVIRLVLQFLVQAVGLIVFRVTHPEVVRPFRMWLYPLPALVAIAGFLFILFGRENWQKEIRYAVGNIVGGPAALYDSGVERPRVAVSRRDGQNQPR